MIILLSTVEVSPRDTACGQRKQMVGWYGSFFFQERWESRMGRAEVKVLILGTSAAKRLT
jgi:hypothetical protein